MGLGGILAFQWEKKQLTLLQNRENWETRVIKAAAWDEDNQILAGRCELNGGTWFGVSKSGRVAFLVDTALMTNNVNLSGGASELYPIHFLKSKWSPEKFANEVKQAEKETDKDDDEIGRAYNLIVADVTSKSMYYICKPDADKPRVETEQVAFGVHTLSLDGLDKDSRLKGLFSEMIGDIRNRQLPSLKELAERFMHDPSFFVEKMDTLPNYSEEREIKRYGTTSTTALVVKPSMEVKFYEKHFERGGRWTHHDFTFNIAA